MPRPAHCLIHSPVHAHARTADVRTNTDPCAPRASFAAAGWTLLCLAWAAVLAGCGSPGKTGDDGAAGDVNVHILDLAAIKQRIAAHKDKKVVVVDFWSTSCEPCMKEFPGLVALADKHPDDVACMSVSLDFEGGKNKKPEDVQAKVLKFLTSLNPPPKRVDNLLSATPSDDVLSDASLNLGGSPPVVVVYGRDGTVAKVFENSTADSEDDYFTYADVSKLVDELLAAK